MEHRQLGSSQLMVSPLAVGSWSFGGNAESYWGDQSQRDVDALVHEALDLGVNLFDTAFSYNSGASEISLGKALRGRRDRAVICNKIPIMDWGELSSYEQQICKSLQRLNTDYIDLMMIHWPIRDEMLLRANLEALERVSARGLIREIGVSNFGVRTLDIAAEEGIQSAANELAYNLIFRGIEAEILPYCISRHIGVITYMPLMQGILSGKYPSLDQIPPARRRTVHFNSEGNPDARHSGPGMEVELSLFLRELRQLARDSGLTQGQLSIAWLCAKQGVTSVIVGCRNLEQLRENIQAVQAEVPPEIIAALDAAGEALRIKLGGHVDLWEDESNSRVW